MLALFFGIISLLYATVGQAGGTAFLALMAFATFPSTEMRPTALALNILAAAYSTWVFNREKVVDWRKLRPFLLSSLPTALVGGFIVLDERVYKTTTGVVLLLAGAAMVLRRGGAAPLDHECPLWGGVSVGAVVGLISGLTGVGGVPGADAHRPSLGFSEANRRPIRTLHLGQLSRWPDRRPSCRAVSLVSLRPVRFGGIGRRDHRNSDRPEVALPNRYTIRSRYHSAGGRYPAS